MKRTFHPAKVPDSLLSGAGELSACPLSMLKREIPAEKELQRTEVIQMQVLLSLIGERRLEGYIQAVTSKVMFTNSYTCLFPQPPHNTAAPTMLPPTQLWVRALPTHKRMPKRGGDLGTRSEVYTWQTLTHGQGMEAGFGHHGFNPTHPHCLFTPEAPCPTLGMP